MKLLRSELGSFFLAAGLGYLAWKVPRLLVSRLETDATDSKLFWISMLPLLAVVGGVVGWLDRRHWLENGAATMLLVLFGAIGEAILIGGHQLLGLEMIMYAILTIPGIIGAFIGKRITKM